MDNYRVSRDRACRYFLRFDQEDLIRTWKLRADETTLFVDFLGRPYGICRKTGAITRLWSGEEAEFEEVLSIFDLLCHAGTGKHLSGTYAPVNSLAGRSPTAGVETSFHSPAAAKFDRNPDIFQATCLALGGIPMELGDMSFRFPVFDGLTVILKFYHSDEEFPASAILLWDSNTLQYIFYETVFYIAGFLIHSILEIMERSTT